MINYGTKLRAIRAEFKLNQTDFAKKLGMKLSAYEMVENNKTGCSLQLLEKLFKDLNVNPRWFFLDEGEMFRNDAPERQNIASKLNIPSTSFGKIRSIACLENLIKHYMQLLVTEHGIVEKDVRLIIDNYAANEIEFNDSDTLTKFIKP